MKKSVFTLFSTVVLAGSLVACSESDITKIDTPAETPAEEASGEVPAEADEGAAESPSETPTEQAKPAETTMAVGDSVQFNDMTVTLNSVRKYTGAADGWDAPTNDYYLIFDVLVENGGAEPQNVSSMMNFTLYDEASYAQDASIMVEVKGSLDGEIGAGRKLAGEIAFDVTDSNSFEFIYSDPFATGQAIWKINKEDIQQ